jgi:hypothetical protein
MQNTLFRTLRRHISSLGSIGLILGHAVDAFFVAIASNSVFVDVITAAKSSDLVPIDSFVPSFDDPSGNMIKCCLS